MNYVSTRGAAPVLEFESVLLAGLARDGGLYVPEAWPTLSEADQTPLVARDYRVTARAVTRPFIGDFDPDRFARLIDLAAASFAHAQVAPLRQLGAGAWLMELFHGPTLAFKDVALQLLGPLFDDVLTERGERVTIVGATSGDTGSAAIEACRDRGAVEIFILHPEGRVSEIQRLQMTTVDAANVHNIAIRGTFDDCQALLKGLFADEDFRARARLSAVNSINWVRVLAQVVYYAQASLALGAPGRPVSFCVPSGNFGNIFAGYVAKRMGLPIGRLIIATNKNDILHRFLETGRYELGEVSATQSPSMDIQVSSNFERLLFDLLDRDGGAVVRLLDDLGETGGFAVSPETLARARADFASHAVSEEETAGAMARIERDYAITVDPHTAVGLAAAEALARPGESMVTLATADPAKFADAVEAATGHRPALPPRLADLARRPEHCDLLDNDIDTLRAHILARIGLPNTPMEEHPSP